MHQKSRPQTHNRKMSFWGQTSRFPGTHSNHQRNRTTNTQNTKLLTQSQIPEIQKRSTTLPGIRQLLQELHPKTLRQTHPLLQPTQKRWQDNNITRS